MARGYDFHPEAEIDLDAVWEFIAEDNPEAADRVIDAIEATIKALVRFPTSRSSPPRSYLALAALHEHGELPHSLRAG
jgi:plasmid stabilization system protein ParE